MSEAAAPTVSVVVPTYNRRERLRTVLAPLLEDDGTLEVVVVVDGSTDGSVELLEEISASEPRLRAVVTENQGLPLARLTGARAAVGEVVLMLDDDLLPSPGLATGHARAHQGRDRLVVVGYMPVSTRRRRPREFARELYGREYERAVSGWEREPGTILTSFWAGNFSLRRVDYVGLADEIAQVVSGYHEDLDFGLRCKRAGLRGEFDRSLLATHLYERDAAGFLRDARSSGANRALLHERHQEDLGPAREDDAVRDLPRPLHPVVGAGIRLKPAALGLRGAAWLAGTLRLFTLERRLAGLVWRVEQARAARAATFERMREEAG